MLRRKRFQQLARIRVVGIGHGGMTAVNAMIDAGVSGVDYVTVDGCRKDLKQSHAPVVVYASRATEGERASPARSQLRSALHESDMVFIVGGLGGETTTWLAPLVATVARDEGALTTGIFTTPFAFEGASRANLARRAMSLLEHAINTLIVVPNDRLLQMAGGALPFHKSYEMALKIWRQSVQGISDLVNAPGLVNVDFADVRTIMNTGGPSIIAMGQGRGRFRARRAAEQASNAPYLDVTIDGARGVLFNISGGPDMSLHEVRQAAGIIRQRADPDVNLIFGATIDERLKDEIRITLIATGCGLSAPALAQGIVSSRADARATAASDAHIEQLLTQP